MVNRFITKNLNMAKEYNYEITLVLTYPKEITEEQILEGSPGLLKEDEKWLVDTLKENKIITTNKVIYSL